MKQKNLKELGESNAVLQSNKDFFNSLKELKNPLINLGGNGVKKALGAYRSFRINKFKVT